MNKLFDDKIKEVIQEQLKRSTLPKDELNLRNDNDLKRYNNACEFLLTPDLSWDIEGDEILEQYQDNVCDYTGEWIIWITEICGTEHKDLIEMVAQNGFVDPLEYEEFMCY